MPQVVVWTLGGQLRHLQYKEEGYKGRRKEASEVLNTWRDWVCGNLGREA